MPNVDEPLLPVFRVQIEEGDVILISGEIIGCRGHGVLAHIESIESKARGLEQRIEILCFIGNNEDIQHNTILHGFDHQHRTGRQYNDPFGDASHEKFFKPCFAVASEHNKIGFFFSCNIDDGLVRDTAEDESLD